MSKKTLLTIMPMNEKNGKREIKQLRDYYLKPNHFLR